MCCLLQKFVFELSPLKVACGCCYLSGGGLKCKRGICCSRPVAAWCGVCLAHAKGSVLTCLWDHYASTCPLLQQQNSAGIFSSFQKMLFMLRSYSTELQGKVKMSAKELELVNAAQENHGALLGLVLFNLMQVTFCNNIPFKIKSLFCEAQFCVFTIILCVTFLCLFHLVPSSQPTPV